MLESKKLSRSSTISRIGFAMCGLVLIAIGCYWSLSASARAKAKDAVRNSALTAYLTPDGTFDLTRGFSGSLDPKGFRMEYAENGAPRFVPAAAALAPGDELWDSRFISNGLGGPDSFAEALAIIGTDVYVGGIFSSAGGIQVGNIAKWNGSGWSALGSGVSSQGLGVTALAVSGSDLYVGGEFGMAGGISVSNVAKWNGSSWSALGSGVGGSVYALAVSGSDLYVGGNFSSAGGIPAKNIAKWNGSSWSALGSGADWWVDSLAASGSDLYVGGRFSTAGGISVNRIAKWNGSSWSALGSGVNGVNDVNNLYEVYALAVNGSDLYIGGNFNQVGGVAASKVAKWNGSSWSALSSGLGGTVNSPAHADALVVSGNDLYVGGNFISAGGTSASNIAKWNGSNWSALGSGVNSRVFALAREGTKIYAAGSFTTAGLNASSLIGLYTKPPIVVNSLADGTPANNGQCTLREALINANNNNQSGSTDCAAGSGPDAIAFSITGTINLTGALPDITDSLTIAGPGANQLTVRRDTGGDYRIFNIPSGLSIGISGLTISSGKVNGPGGGILSRSNLLLTNCAIVNNEVSGFGSGGGVSLQSADGSFTGCTFNGNVAIIAGAGVHFLGDGGHTLTVTNCTLSSNTIAAGFGGGIFNASFSGSSTLEVINSTIANNAASQAGGGIHTRTSGAGTTATTRLRNTIVANNSLPNLATDMLSGGGPATVTSLGYNLASDNGSGFLTGPGDQINKDPKLGPLANNGGPTQTQALLPGSPAIDAGTATGAPTTDQRGVSRPKGGGVDIGAFEFVPPTVVNSLADGTPANNGQCTLREALINANNNNQSGSTDCAAGGLGDTITFSVTGTINLTGALPDINDGLTIIGPGANLLTVQRNTGGDYRIFNIPSGQTVTFTGLTIANGSVPTDVGGGVLNSGALTVTNCAITGNSGLGGAGIENRGSLTMTGSTVSGNTAVLDGSGVRNEGNANTSLTNCTISGNTNTGFFQSTVYNVASAGTALLVMTNCTVTANTANQIIKNHNTGGGVITTQLGNTLVAGNSGENFSIINTTPPSLTNSLDSDGTSGATNGVGGNLVGTTANKLNAKIGPLANNGGTTQTHLLLCGSPAINAGSNTGAPTTDQRGFVRPVGGTTDIGAVEGDYSLSLSATALPKGRVNTTYPTQTLSATGGAAPYVFTAVTPLPGGLTLGANGAINGTPTTAVSNFNFTVMAVDAVGKQGCRDYLLTIDPACPTIAITPATLPNGQLGQSYNQQLTQSGGTGAIAWSFTGNLPGNVTLNPTTGLISGAPTTSGTFNFSVTATDANGCASAPKAYSLVIASCPAITINPTTLPSGQIGLQYSQQLTQTGGTGTLMWSFAGGLPTGVTMNLTTGLISGKPTVSGTFDFSVAVKDANGCMSSTPKSYSLVIAPCPTITITPASLSPGTVNIQFTQLLTASGGTAPYTFSVNAGSTLPPGLSLSGDTLLGSPTTASSFPFTIKVTDAAGCTGTQSYTLVVNPAITSNGLQFYPLTKPLRLLDTRPANERPGGAFDLPGVKLTGELNGGTPRTQNGRVTFDGLTIPANAKAIVGTATVINYPGAGQYTGTGNVTFYPSNKPKPEVSNLNYAANQTISNGFTVALGDDGAFKIFSYSDVHLVVDVVGYYAPPGAGGLYFHPLPRPVRALETRPELFYPGCETPRAKLLAGSTRLLQGRFSCEGITIPSAAQALVGNLTSVNANANGEAEVYASDVAPLPLANTLSYVSTQAIPNAFVTRLSGAGSYNLYVSQTTDMLVDLTGYFSAEANDINGQGLLLTLLETPIRKLETRPELFYPGCITPRAPLAGGSETVIPALGTCDGVTIPATARALIGNATVVNFVSQGSGNVTLYPTAANRPESSNLNYVANQVIPNAFTVGLSADGKFTVYVFSTIHLLIDVSGYYAP